MGTRIVLGIAVFGLAFSMPAAAPAQQVYRNVSPEKIEKILNDLNIQFKKSQGNKPGIHFYDYSRNGYKIRLHNYEGKDLWIDAIFSDRVDPVDVNRWNVRAKFSRAVLLNTNNVVTVSLENQFDCLGGITDANIRQFINRFDGEVREFVDFVKSTLPR